MFSSPLRARLLTVLEGMPAQLFRAELTKLGVADRLPVIEGMRGRSCAHVANIVPLGVPVRLQGPLDVVPDAVALAELLERTELDDDLGLFGGLAALLLRSTQQLTRLGVDVELQPALTLSEGNEPLTVPAVRAKVVGLALLHHHMKFHPCEEVLEHVDADGAALVAERADLAVDLVPVTTHGLPKESHDRREVLAELLSAVVQHVVLLHARLGGRVLGIVIPFFLSPIVFPTFAPVATPAGAQTKELLCVVSHRDASSSS